MKILKHGDVGLRKFICNNCGCQFVAHPNEYNKISFSNVTLWYEVNCPDCGVLTDCSEYWEEENETGI